MENVFCDCLKLGKCLSKPPVIPMISYGSQKKHVSFHLNNYPRKWTTYPIAVPIRKMIRTGKLCAAPMSAQQVE